jgi:hypothetical protein
MGDVNSHGIYSVFNETAPAPLMSSPSSGFVFARRKRTAFKGPMLHTANLIVSNGLGTPSLSPELQTVDVRPTTRKSQIIEEEEDDLEDEDIEEVDTFSNPDGVDVSFEDAGEATLDNEPVGEDLQTQEPAPGSLEDDATATIHRPVLAPAPDLRDSGLHPPRSSSLNLPDLQDQPHSGIKEREESTAKKQTTPSSQPVDGIAAVEDEHKERSAEERPLTATKHVASDADTTQQ